ncbi:unnamed protein product [Microthlaspi erraticum]|uniref:F-box domain-containing protein n=1 Tax=Microthlaspi erraticum TaxID=1685480 RepID=A0A6D2IDF0_9BRAS|nr:unnamed protein product [Microthlaspi erraticum]
MMFTDLPRELEWEILSRVPATTLTQFRSTCTRWYALFKDPIFIKKNLGKAERQAILKTRSGVFSVNVNLHGRNNSFDPSIEFTGKLNSLNDSEQVMIYSIFQCDGLFLCQTKDHGLVVWNPCTGQTRWIQPSSFDRGSDEYFLGYVNNNKSCHSYKLLCSSFFKTRFEIYDFNSDSWKELDYAGARLSFTRNSGVSLKGKIYWPAEYEKETLHSSFLTQV